MHKILGLDFATLNALDAGEQHLQKAARLRPDSAEIRYFLGRIYYTRGTYPLAKKEFEEALRLDPTYVKAYDNLGLACEALGSNDAAITNYEKAIELSKHQNLSYEWPYVNLSDLYNRQNKPEIALEFSQKACELNQLCAQAFYEKGRALRMLQQWEPAAKALEKAIELNPQNGQYFYVISYVYARLGRRDESRKALDTFRKLGHSATPLAEVPVEP